MAKVISLLHRLGGMTSHTFNEAHGYIREFAARRRELVLLVNARAQRRAVTALGAWAVLEDPTFRLDWSIEERSSRFSAMLHKRADRFVERGDRVLMTVATQVETHALVSWLQELPHHRKPWIALVYMSDRWNRHGPAEYERQVAEFRVVAEAIRGLSEDDARRVLFFALTQPLADELGELLGTTVTVCPIPLEFPELRATATDGAHPPRVVVAGGTRREKGSLLLPDIIRACRSRVNVELVIQLANDSLGPEEVAVMSALAREPGVTTIAEGMTVAAYHGMIAGADLALFPYDVVPYRKRTSGIFAEAVACGTVVVASPGTWMAEQIESGRAAGAVSADLRPESFADAIARCVADLPSLQQTARALSEEWRRTMGLPAFIDLIEREIAARGGDEAAAGRRRRWWWPF